MTGTKPRYKIGNDEGLPEMALALRRQWKVQEPELDIYPRWFRPAVNAAIRRGELDKANRPLATWDAMVHVGQCLGRDWFDHAGRVKLANGTHLLVSEPYGLNDTARGQLARFCSVLRLQCHISACSWWYPGRTIRIELQPAMIREVAR